MVLNAGAVISILILAGCAAAVVYIWLRSYRWMREDHSRPIEEPKDEKAKPEDTPDSKGPQQPDA